MMQPNRVDDWQAAKSQVRERVSFLFNNELFSDVCFIVDKASNAERIPAHKLVLSIGSSVFCAMFNGSLATKSDSVEITDVPPSAFIALLR